MLTGSIKIKNVSGAPYEIEELGRLVIEDQEVIDLLDPELPQHYTSWDDANRLVTELATAKLRQSIQAGDIEVVLNAEGHDV